MLGFDITHFRFYAYCSIDISMNPLKQKPTLIFEMLDIIEKAPTRNDKIEALRYMRCLELEAILQMNYHYDVQLDLPSGPIDFEKDNGDPDMSAMRTRNAIPYFRDLIKSSPLSQSQKLKKFIGILESVNEREAEVFMLAKDRKLIHKWPSITIDLVREAIPNIV